MKEKALDCLTAQQRDLANVLMTQDIKNLARATRNLSQHPRPSKFFAKAAVRKAFQDLELNIKHPGLMIADFEDVIGDAPPLLSQTDRQPLFKEEDDDDVSPRMLEERIAELRETIQEMERESEDCLIIRSLPTITRVTVSK